MQTSYAEWIHSLRILLILASLLATGNAFARDGPVSTELRADAEAQSTASIG